MFILGLCGQSGAGKTTALQVFSEKGFTVCDSDKVSREVMKKGHPCYREVISVFGGGILSEDGEIDRRALGEIVFNDKELLAILTEITHRHIKNDIYKRISESSDRGDEKFVIDAPLLFESGLDKICDLTLAITAPDSLRIERTVIRDSITPDLAEKRMKNQMSTDTLKKLSDAVIENSSAIEEFREKILTFIEKRGL
jgi:dephospho-CoA kinase